MAALREAQILISEPAVIASLLRHDASALENLKWCQSSFAGVDPLFRAGLELPLSFQLTRFAGCFGPPIAEWTLARIIEHERGFAATASDQLGKKWAGSRERVLSYRYLSRMTLSILGCGDIGTCIAAAAKAFGMNTVGYTRTPRGADEKESGVDEYTTDISYALQAADFIVSVLPSTQETVGLLSDEALAIASTDTGGKYPVFLNVGRGDVIDEASIIQALDNHYISAAILDVFEVEPLPVESPLWHHPKVTVSPHVSGLTQASDVPKVFLSNYKRYVEGESLHHAVDWDKGY
uniref:D-isomer specific 2-hydroxyacid dehydrogenase NAD-binding domain-containing protein n=1 Tax=Minutocellus polymorphus TaxID=265543 RepID=A0A7S0ACQ9_9STRA|mmetsp:Transcript_1107/g.1919  ORF Transcript_1107/g.1919 Transcript_1107/m.1919 type:complete len:294 (+) Transcript_1107:2-883(+)